MPIHFDKELIRTGSIVVKINSSGIIGDTLIEENIKLNIYAFDSSSGKIVFSSYLKIEELREFYSYLSNFSIIKDGTHKSLSFREVGEELNELIDQISKADPKLLVKLLEKTEGNQKIRALLSSLTNEELQELDAARKQNSYKKELKNLEKLIMAEVDNPTSFISTIKEDGDLSGYLASQPEKVFQNWIEKNLWTFGGDYYKKHDARKIALDSESDLIIENPEGFIDLIELKKPSAKVFKLDRSHDSFYPSQELSMVIGQSLNYLKKLDVYKAILEKDYKVKVLKPRIIIVIGSSKDFDDNQFETLRLLNSNLNHIKVVTYDYLISNGKKVIECYES